MAGLDPGYLKLTLDDSSNSKSVLLPDKQNVLLLINPGTDQATPSSQEGFRGRH